MATAGHHSRRIHKLKKYTAIFFRCATSYDVL